MKEKYKILYKAGEGEIIEKKSRFIAEIRPVESEEEAQAFVAEMRKHFGKEIKIERVIAAQGENPITEYLAFGGPKPENKNSRWSYYASCKGRILDQPEEAADVRGAAATDYQALLEKQWLKQLHKKYKVKVNKKVLNSIKSTL